MAWVYALILAAAVGFGVTAITTYRSAIRGEATAKQEASVALARARLADTQRKELQELFDKADQLAKEAQHAEANTRAKLAGANSTIADLINNKPEVAACERCVVDPLIRKLRRDVFAPTSEGDVLRPQDPARPDAGSAAPR